MTDAAWRIRHVDLSAGLPEETDSAVPEYRVYWWGPLPLGMRAYLAEQLPLGRAESAAVAAELIAAQVAARSPSLGGPHAAAYDGQPRRRLGVEQTGAVDPLAEIEALAQAAAAPAAAERLSVIVCTRDRPADLARCLPRLEAQIARPREIIVVDNSGGRSAEAVCAAHPGVRYVHEPRPGLSRARNAGLAALRTPLVAFTDDDAEPGPTWTAEILRAFQDPSVDAVTGLVLPASLDTRAKRVFQLDLGGFTSSCDPLRYGAQFMAETRPVGPQVWRLGAGANMAFRRAVFDRVGDFDERLGAGAAGCSEDSELWYRILAAGGVCLYEPRAVVSHHHRADMAGLKRQMHAYMKGHVAALVVQADRCGDRGNVRRIVKQMPMYFLRTAAKALQNDDPVRLSLLVSEVLGWASGLQYLVRLRWRRAGAAGPARKPRLAAAPEPSPEPSHA